VTILVIGRSGQVARALMQRAGVRGVALIAKGRPGVDLEQRETIRDALNAMAPSVVINAGAYTAVEAAEDEREAAFRVNAAGAEAVAAAAGERGVPVIQLSTEYVFSGEKISAYVEGDVAVPRNVYGESKLEAERLAVAANPRTIVVRTSWVFGVTGTNFVRTMLRKAKSGGEVRVVADQIGCPTYADDLADALLTIAVSPAKPGIYHCTGADETSWADFAREVFAESRARGGPFAEVIDIASEASGARAVRPKNSRLDCGKLTADYAIRMRYWREALAACMDEIAARGWSVE